ncbi:MAG TPA: phosphatidylinositol mannoside acyltransferase [Micromonosporaceae bacterium]|jgi:KDO2-lipid IV(A) lauroyltransferase
MTSLVEFGYAAGWSVIKALPRSVVWPVFRAGADRAARRNGPAAQRLRRNLRQVVGPDLPEAELDVLVREGLRSYAKYWMDAFRLPRLSLAHMDAQFYLEGAHLLGDSVKAGTGCVIALPHAGNWDMAGAWVCAQGWPLTTVAERLKPEGLYQKFVDYRTSLGMEIVPTVGGARAPLDILTERLGQARIVPLLADRDLSARGIEVRFFGGRTRMPAGPAMLALRTGAPLFVVSLWYEGLSSRGRVDGPIPMPENGPLDVRVRALTQTIADLLARGIAEHPQDWHMLQRLWLAEARPGADEPDVPGERATAEG